MFVRKIEGEYRLCTSNSERKGRVKRNAVVRDWYLVKPRSPIKAKSIVFPKELAGKRVKLVAQVIEDKPLAGDTSPEGKTNQHTDVIMDLFGYHTGVRVMNYILANSVGEFCTNDVKEGSGAGTTSTINHIERLEDMGFIKESRTNGRGTYFKVNHNNKYARFMLKFYNSLSRLDRE